MGVLGGGGRWRVGWGGRGRGGRGRGGGGGAGGAEPQGPGAQSILYPLSVCQCVCVREGSEFVVFRGLRSRSKTKLDFITSMGPYI